MTFLTLQFLICPSLLYFYSFKFSDRERAIGVAFQRSSLLSPTCTYLTSYEEQQVLHSNTYLRPRKSNRCCISKVFSTLHLSYLFRGAVRCCTLNISLFCYIPAHLPSNRLIPGGAASYLWYLPSVASNRPHLAASLLVHPF